MGEMDGGVSPGEEKTKGNEQDACRFPVCDGRGTKRNSWARGAGKETLPAAY